ncbi:MAG: metallophosphoesterase [Methanoregula sp.]|nr:metallophosphoesterase [Methanoregula sp.]
MGVLFFSDVHADARAIAMLASCIRRPLFAESFGHIDRIINLGDILHRGTHPKESIEIINALALDYLLISILGNHDHAFLNDIVVSGSDLMSAASHEKLRNSPLLSIFDQMPLEWVEGNMLCVHGGPLNLGNHILRLKCWQRLSHNVGDSFTGYHYTAQMAFTELAERGLTHMVCGHQHTHICCRKTADEIREYPIDFIPSPAGSDKECALEVARVPLDLPALFRIGSCYGDEPEFAYADDSAFSYIRILQTNR